MELAVIILFVLSIAVVSALVGRFEKRRAAAAKDRPASAEPRPTDGQPARPARPSRPRPAPGETGTSPQAAKDAAALLSADQHRQIYAALGQGQPVKALKLYAMFTGAGIRASGAAIQNMAAHPQPYVRPIPDPAPESGSDAAPAKGAATPDAAAQAGKADPVEEEEISKWAQQLRPEDFLKP